MPTNEESNLSQSVHRASPILNHLRDSHRYHNLVTLVSDEMKAKIVMCSLNALHRSTSAAHCVAARNVSSFTEWPDMVLSFDW